MLYRKKLTIDSAFFYSLTLANFGKQDRSKKQLIALLHIILIPFNKWSNIDHGFSDLFSDFMWILS